MANMDLSEEEWKERLPAEKYHILREKGTEPPFSGKYNHWKEKGCFYCAACHYPVFHSDAKYDSGTGWPSFYQPIQADNIGYHQDQNRIEVICSHCESHLGHVFNDGPPPTGYRYCINSLALDFHKEQ